MAKVVGGMSRQELANFAHPGRFSGMGASRPAPMKSGGGGMSIMGSSQGPLETAAQENYEQMQHESALMPQGSVSIANNAQKSYDASGAPVTNVNYNSYKVRSDGSLAGPSVERSISLQNTEENGKRYMSQDQRDAAARVGISPGANIAPSDRAMKRMADNSGMFKP